MMKYMMILYSIKSFQYSSIFADVVNDGGGNPALLVKLDSQLPNFRGQAWPSMGKSTSFMGHCAMMVNLEQHITCLLYNNCTFYIVFV